jgi:hypothetical protein
MIKDNPKKDWPEDWSHENGMYYCRCVHCSEQFIGYKRRVVCKECHTNLMAASDIMSGGGYEESTLEKQREFAEQRNYALDEDSIRWRKIVERL